MGYTSFDRFEMMSSTIPVIIQLGFIIILGIIVLMAIKGMAQWNKNNNSPVLDVNAKVVAKRLAIGHHTHHHGDDMAMHHTSSSTTYYATFEVESGDRIELNVPSLEYGMLVEGDVGKLTFQGTRYKFFERRLAK
jgi:hypothetical protein